MSTANSHSQEEPSQGDQPLNIASPKEDSPPQQASTDDNVQKQADVAPTKVSLEYLENDADLKNPSRANRAARAGIEQNHIIPTDGEETPTTKWEKYSFMVFRMSVGGTAINSYGNAKNQAFLNGAHPDGMIQFGGSKIPVNSYLLDLNGILFAVQLVLLLTIGPYADYGRWRPYLLIFFESLIYVCCFVIAGFNDYSDWRAVNAFWFLGVLSLNLANTFYFAGFPAVVRNFPEIRQSEREVLMGTKSAEEHGQYDSLSRAKFYNYCIGVASTINLVLLGIATGIAAGIGVKNTYELLLGYKVLISLFAVLEVIGTAPYLYIFAKKNRPGQALPAGVPFYMAGLIQLKQAVRYAWDLKQFLIYLLSYFIIQEAFGASGNVQLILQNQVIQYNTIQLSGLTALDFFTGCTGTLFVNWIQQRWKIRSKSMLIYGAVMTVALELWGAIGAHTNVIGYHHVWEFWLANVWNFQSAAWNSYYVILLSELVPQPKMYMFFALLNCVGKTSGFIGPFISSAIIDKSGGNTNMAYWFLFSMGVLGTVVLCFVNPDKAKIDVAKFLEREAEQLYTEEQRDEARTVS